ncbi:PTS system mannose/fructose/N-acetylgalactosamine-transporter subunit IIB [Clostridium ljungdahlii]|uniref:Sorbose-specific phosphotransferase enzyme IIB component n=1 Tax=Clostridium ljungdahlii TaxID=1538 RepID=A0A162L1I1_9CLOT|nr:PTS sugar transporter subunit IIB [Clostridium ljungdahlii]OAA83058.1 Sorbose-specific phosphotransferase enzyme IIB component [Clostridium ljungdahlii]
MSIIHVRIDERLIHGQVATVWTNTLGCSRIMVVNDEACNSETQKYVLKLATPPSVHLSVLTVEKAAVRIKEGKYDNDKVFVIFKNPKDCVRLLEKGIELPMINVGNMAPKDESTNVKKSVNVSKEDVEAFKKLSSMGLKITARMVPDEPESNFMNLIKDL